METGISSLPVIESTAHFTGYRRSVRSGVELANRAHLGSAFSLPPLFERGEVPVPVLLLRSEDDVYFRLRVRIPMELQFRPLSPPPVGLLWLHDHDFLLGIVTVIE